MSLVEVRSVTKRYHKGDETITPLDGASLDVETGQFVSLMGASGTGKSTLLNLIAGIDRAEEGTINVAGTDITRLSRSRLANWRAANIGYVFQKLEEMGEAGRSELQAYRDSLAGAKGRKR